MTPPMPSSRFSTVSRCSSMNSCSLGISRATREGTVNPANSAIASFSLCSRSACGALNTRAPSRTAAERSQVLATYSRSNGGSLRISATLVSLYALSESSGSTMKSRFRLLALRNHELERGAHLVVGKRWVAALGRHRALAFQRRLQQGAYAVLEVRRPRRLVAELRRAGDAGCVARHAGGLVHLLAI